MRPLERRARGEGATEYRSVTHLLEHLGQEEGQGLSKVYWWTDALVVAIVVADGRSERIELS